MSYQRVVVLTPAAGLLYLFCTRYKNFGRCRLEKRHFRYLIREFGIIVGDYRG